MSRSRTFCCCLPVRLGVFVMSLLQLIFAGAAAGLVWWTVIHEHVHGATRTAFIVIGSVESLMAAAAFLGFIGAVSRARGLVAIYSTVLYVLIVAYAAAGAYFLYMLYRNGGQEFADACNRELDKLPDAPKTGNVDVDDLKDDVCDGLTKGAKWAYPVSFGISLLIQLYCAYIVSSYVGQLSDEQAFRAADRNWQGTAPPQSYYAHQPLSGEQNQSLLHAQPKYPYADPEHSFGAPKREIV
ncbi:hypothetical protein AURDEDRAFT_145790 [Auricularia subglabra TFB-10046 SS5]|nr:hypothetical protein AURDEDRAFT_145790 [Auricularia subglabra TFB-10046 SS5]